MSVLTRVKQPCRLNYDELRNQISANFQFIIQTQQLCRPHTVLCIYVVTILLIRPLKKISATVTTISSSATASTNISSCTTYKSTLPNALVSFYCYCNIIPPKLLFSPIQFMNVPDIGRGKKYNHYFT